MGRLQSTVIHYLESFWKYCFRKQGLQKRWSDTDKSGKKLTEGVYYHTVTPTSIKYEYADK